MNSLNQLNGINTLNGVTTSNGTQSVDQNKNLINGINNSINGLPMSLGMNIFKMSMRRNKEEQ